MHEICFCFFRFLLLDKFYRQPWWRTLMIKHHRFEPFLYFITFLAGVVVYWMEYRTSTSQSLDQIPSDWTFFLSFSYAISDIIRDRYKWITTKILVRRIEAKKKDKKQLTSRRCVSSLLLKVHWEHAAQYSNTCYVRKGLLA